MKWPFVLRKTLEDAQAGHEVALQAVIKELEKLFQESKTAFQDEIVLVRQALLASKNEEQRLLGLLISERHARGEPG